MKLLLVSLLIWIAGCNSGNADKQPVPVRQGPPPLAAPAYMPLGTYVVNMPGGKFYLKTTVQLAFAEKPPMDWMLLRAPLVKDLLISYLQGITVAQFDDIKTRQLLKTDIRSRMNSLFPNQPPWEDKAPVKKILFSEFYKQ